MNLKSLNDFLDNSLNLRSYELYKVVGELVLRQENHRTQEIQVQYLRNIEALLVEKGMTLFEEELKNQNKNENAILVNSTKIKNLSNLSIITNDENILFQEDTIYLIKINEEYFIVDEIFKNYDFSEQDASFITKIDLTNFKKINSNVKFVLDEPKKLEDELITEAKNKEVGPLLNNFSLEFPNTTLINQISAEAVFYVNGAEGEKYVTKKIILEPENTNIYNVPLILNPFYVGNEQHKKVLWLSRFHNFLYHIDYYSWSAYLKSSKKLNLKLQLFPNKPDCYDLLVEIFNNSNLQKSNFKNLTDEEITALKNKYGTLNMSDVNDYLIDQKIKELELHDLKTANKLRSVILALSGYLLTSFSIKGGLNEEHKIALPFYFLVSNNSLEDITLNSIWFNFQNGELKSIKEFLNNVVNDNLIIFNNEVLQFPTPPQTIEEINVTNLPIEFNSNKSSNLNYVFYTFFNNEFDVTKYLSLQTGTIQTETIENQVFTVSFDSVESYLIARKRKDEFIVQYKGIYNESVEDGWFVLKPNILKEQYKKWQEEIQSNNLGILNTYLKSSGNLIEQANKLGYANFEVVKVEMLYDESEINRNFKADFTVLSTQKYNECIPGSKYIESGGMSGGYWNCNRREVDIPDNIIIRPKLKVTVNAYKEKYTVSEDAKQGQVELLKNKFVFNDFNNQTYLNKTDTSENIKLNFNVLKNMYLKNLVPAFFKSITITSIFGSWMKIKGQGINKSIVLNSEYNQTTTTIELFDASEWLKN